jgi:hypothetical protein
VLIRWLRPLLWLYNEAADCCSACWGANHPK